MSLHGMLQKNTPKGLLVIILTAHRAGTNTAVPASLMALPPILGHGAWIPMGSDLAETESSDRKVCMCCLRKPHVFPPLPSKTWIW
jgi:hypothetical protein